MTVLGPKEGVGETVVQHPTVEKDVSRFCGCLGLCSESANELSVSAGNNHNPSKSVTRRERPTVVNTQASVGT